MRGAQPVERALGTLQRFCERRLGDPVRADRLGARVVDVLLERHANTLTRSTAKSSSSGAKSIGFVRPLRPADHDGEEFAVQQALADALHVIERHRLDYRAAPP